MIKSVGLTEEVFKRFSAMLSGGEQQRIAIVRAIVSQPKVILADEPTGREKIVQLLKDLAYERNCCVIIVTHDPTVSAQDGEIIQEEKVS